jgi:uncharacterized protein
MANTLNKRKIFNDPVYGFISIPNELVFDLIEHPYFQRLRRIKQLGLTHLVYPGALHTRFHHALGAMHLLTQALETLTYKGVDITLQEAEAVTIAILLHDIGHGPFSHALEHSIAKGMHHEELSLLFMHELNAQFDGKLSMAIQIFTNNYPKHFLHQLVSSQLDMDRLDYLSRDSFFTGVSEGTISSDRIIKMLNVVNDELVIESKGIYSVENFIVSRRLMYWQVYLHKTVLSAENILVNILKRAKELAGQGVQDLFASPPFHQFLYNNYTIDDFRTDKNLLNLFAQIDDYDVMTSIKTWCNHSDVVLSYLSNCMVNRKLFKIELRNEPFTDAYLQSIKQTLHAKYPNLTHSEIDYFVFSREVTNEIYRSDKVRINISYKDGTIKDIAEASDQLNIAVLNKTVKKYFLCTASV